jgi:hypothetical protein
MPRVYVRKFDWDEARRLHAEGRSVYGIAKDLGVSAAAVWRVVDPERRRKMAARSAEYQRSGTCVDCGGPCSRNRARPAARCPDCDGKHKRLVTETEARCVDCKRWLPHDAFSPCRLKRTKDGGSSRTCRECETARRQANREANRERERAYARQRYQRRREQEAA